MSVQPFSSPFLTRHLGPRESDLTQLLERLGFSSLEEFGRCVVPEEIFEEDRVGFPPIPSERQAIGVLRTLASRNRRLRSLIGQGYYGTETPAVIRRCVLENPAWYTAYTPYQPEISQGRLELLFYFQTLICELTGLSTANASLLDEATAAAEAMTMCFRLQRGRKTVFLVDSLCHPQTLQILQSRAKPLGIELREFFRDAEPAPGDQIFGMLLQYPSTRGDAVLPVQWLQSARELDVPIVLATDLLALCVLESPASLGADIAVGSCQRFGVSLGFGGPHAAFISCSERFRRQLPGRLVGQSRDRHGNPAYRLSLQTREQHIRRDKATSNICTAQALLAILSTLYACWHGPSGLREIAGRVHGFATRFARSLQQNGYSVLNATWFDTVTFRTGISAEQLLEKTENAGFNLRYVDSQTVSIAMDELVTDDELQALAHCLDIELLPDSAQLESLKFRTDQYLSQDVFHRYHSETEMMRYLRKLSDYDLALDRTMIPLGSCTMKLNAAIEMCAVTWDEFAGIHPFAPAAQTEGYRLLITELEQMLCEVTGYDAISLQPNAGSQGEYSGLLAIRAYHESRGEPSRNICLIPSSAHGTNPASAHMAGFEVVVVRCDDEGNIDLDHLQKSIAAYPERIAAIMITYPSTHGVFETTVQKVCEAVHIAGGQVYIDGANLNALAGVARPGVFGGDVSHLNLHKTFCIPHGGGGPGVGPVAVRDHLAKFLPSDGVNPERTGPAVSATPFGSAGILPISWMYLKLMGFSGVRTATLVAILNANYVARRLREYCPVLYSDPNGMVAHECILDTRVIEKATGITSEDIAKRLIDYGFHAPTLSFPVAGTLMIEPTESESLEELDRFCDAMIGIFKECRRVENGVWPADNNPLKNAPHTLNDVLNRTGAGIYDMRTAICPVSERDLSSRYLPPVARVDQVYGDRNLVCSCAPVSDYAQSIDSELLESPAEEAVTTVT